MLQNKGISMETLEQSKIETYIEENKVTELFNHNELPYSRMISYSKSTYMSQKGNEYNTIIFNANVFMYLEGKAYKIWYGDLNLSKTDGERLVKIAKELNTTLYVLYEMDGRFENETNEHPKDKAKWNTELPVPYVTTKLKKHLDSLKKLDNKISNLESKKRKKELNFKHSQRPIIELEEIFGRKILKKIPVPYSFINEEATRVIKEYDKKMTIFNKHIKEKGEESAYNSLDFPEYEKGLITNEALDKFLLNFLNIADDKDLDYSNIWVNYKTAKKLTKLATAYELLKNKSEEDKIKKISNFAVYMAIVTKSSLEGYMNKNVHNILSYEDDCIYVLENYEKKKFRTT